MQPKVETWLVQKFIDVADNPRQRNTTRHLAHAHHLREKSPTHQFVSVAVLPSSQYVKLDGHTRALLWSNESEYAPETVSVTIFPVDTIDKVADLYTHFDNRSAVETAADQTFGAFRECGFSPTSPLLIKANIVNATHLAESASRGVRYWRVPGIDNYTVIKLWINEFRLLETISPRARPFIASVLCASLLSLRRRGESALEFWDKFNIGDGTKLDMEIDSVEALLRICAARDKKLANPADSMHFAGRCLSCFESYRANKTYSTKNWSGPKSMNITEYILRPKPKEETISVAASEPSESPLPLAAFSSRGFFIGK